jgi:hypothetical protein
MEWVDPKSDTRQAGGDGYRCAQPWRDCLLRNAVARSAPPLAHRAGAFSRTCARLHSPRRDQGSGQAGSPRARFGTLAIAVQNPSPGSCRPHARPCSASSPDLRTPTRPPRMVLRPPSPTPATALHTPAGEAAAPTRPRRHLRASPCEGLSTPSATCIHPPRDPQFFVPPAHRIAQKSRRINHLPRPRAAGRNTGVKAYNAARANRHALPWHVRRRRDGPRPGEPRRDRRAPGPRHALDGKVRDTATHPTSVASTMKNPADAGFSSMRMVHATWEWCLRSAKNGRSRDVAQPMLCQQQPLSQADGIQK